MLRTSNSADFEAGADLGGQLALGAAQHDVEELLLSRHRGDVLPRRLHLGLRTGDVPAFVAMKGQVTTSSPLEGC